jgi:hypothetical protein
VLKTIKNGGVFHRFPGTQKTPRWAQRLNSAAALCSSWSLTTEEVEDLLREAHLRKWKIYEHFHGCGVSNKNG